MLIQLCCRLLKTLFEIPVLTAATAAVVPVATLSAAIAILPAATTTVIPSAALSTAATVVISAAEILAPTGIPASGVGIAFERSIAVFDERCIAEFEFATGDAVEFTSYRIIVYQFFVPVAVREFHIIGNGMCKPGFLFRILFFQRLVDNGFQVLTQVRIPRVTFRVTDRVWLGFVSLFLRYRVRAVNIQLEIADEEKVIPQLMTEVLYVLEVRVQETHQLYHYVGLLLPFVFVFDRHQVFHHLLDMPAILPHAQVVSRCIVFHVHWS